MAEEQPPRRSNQSVMDYRMDSLERRMGGLEDTFKAVTVDLSKIKERISIAIWVIVGAGLAFNVIGPDAAELLKVAFAA